MTARQPQAFPVSSFPFFDMRARGAGASRLLQWAWIVVASIVIHLLLLDALPRFVIEAASDEPPLAPLRARLMPPIRAATPTPAPAPLPSPPPGSTKPSRAKPATAAPAPNGRETFVPESLDIAPQVQARPPIVEPAPVAVAADPAPTTPPTPAPPPITVTPPLSARMEYTALSQNIKEANPIYGNGTITWSTADGAYRVALDATAKALFFNLDLLSSRSEGAIGVAGLAPDRYTEKTRRRAMLATNFNRDARQSVTFSASPASVPLPSGVQDRLSILFQIGGLLLADPSRAVAGSHIEVPVANVRDDVEHWTFVSFGPVTIDTGVGPTTTTHLQRTPKPGSNDRTLDLWVADDGGYPAQVRYTEPNGSTVTMTLDRIGAVE